MIWLTAALCPVPIQLKTSDVLLWLLLPSPKATSLPPAFSIFYYPPLICSSVYDSSSFLLSFRSPHLSPYNSPSNSPNPLIHPRRPPKPLNMTANGHSHPGLLPPQLAISSAKSPSSPAAPQGSAAPSAWRTPPPAPSSSTPTSNSNPQPPSSSSNPSKAPTSPPPRST